MCPVSKSDGGCKAGDDDDVEELQVHIPDENSD